LSWIQVFAMLIILLGIFTANRIKKQNIKKAQVYDFNK